MPKKRNPKSTAKDFCFLWKWTYEQVIGSKFVIHWAADGSIFRRLISNLTNKQIRDVVDFAFSGHPSTEYIRKQGFPIRLLPSQVQLYLSIIENPGITIPEEDLDLEIPYWNDVRLSYLWSCVRESDINSLICNVTDEYYWELLFAKMRRQQGYITTKAKVFFEHWKDKRMLKRTAIKYENRPCCRGVSDT
jgi:hypothetical protein